MTKHFSITAFLAIWLLLPLFGGSANAQIIADAAQWKISLSNKADGTGQIHFAAKVKRGWHVYDIKLPAGGPTPTNVTYEGGRGYTLVGELRADDQPSEIFDPNYNMTLRWFEKDFSLTQDIKITDPENLKIEGYLEFMACDNKSCIPPEKVEFSLGKNQMTTPVTASVTTTLTENEHAATTAEQSQADETAAPTSAEEVPATASAQGATLSKEALWTPVISELKAYGDRTLAATDHSLLMVFILGFLGGLVALLTPCVWPMIPMTVSFFLKRSKSRREAIKDAVIYGISIVVIYVSMGLIITSIFGADALNNLSTNSFFNILFFLLLVIFAISFFGAFEIVLPQRWTNKLDSKADSITGLISIFFMAFTLGLVSFSCTGPIVGTLLVEAATMGNFLGPTIGMLGFSLALALPFSLFAVFPNVLQNLPKSGGWLNSVKVVLGFLELALAFKFLSVADLAYGWGILNRDIFVAIWIVIFALLGLYLIGKLRLPHDSEVQTISVSRLFLAMVSFSFAMWMVPGLWGAPLKAISAFAPPSYTQPFNLYDDEVHPMFDDYESAIAYAQTHNKPILIDFSGYGCVNCRKMEAAVWTDSRVKSKIEKDFVLVTLMVDDKTKMHEPIEVEESGRTRKLRTIGDKWSYFQRHKFGSNSQPFYVMIDPSGRPLGPSYGFDDDVKNYLDFLNGGLEEFKKRD